MNLTDVEFCRSLAFVEGLRIIAEKETERSVTVAQIPEEGIRALQAFTVERASDYAKLNFPDLSFPDETKRETPESLAQWEAWKKSEQNRIENLRFDEGESFVWKRGADCDNGVVLRAGRI